MPDGSCDAECTPTLEEQIRACDEQLASGEINAIQHYMCVMGPGGPGEQWETCFATVWDIMYFILKISRDFIFLVPHFQRKSGV